jgi:hypothetical protein
MALSEINVVWHLFQSYSPFERTLLEALDVVVEQCGKLPLQKTANISAIVESVDLE